ncbi:hypothetical protein [Hymenobacter glacieicola]|uniref:hypothetical protein n=1 Tax=Hymenobacter glacieicola TaxID=1562124 RepID=UPI00166669DA|nr:hypothetical protein [Hymenobacter glacieicola]
MLTPAAQYLTYAEAVALYQQLRQADIDALVKTCGPPTFPFGEGMYYQLLIEQADASAAQATVEAFERQRATPPAPRCPRCGAPEPMAVPRPAWWKRVFYAGTALHKCPRCGAEFPL